MLKILIIIVYRLAKSAYRVLLVGPTPKPPPDFEKRLHEVELIAWRLDKRAQRAGDDTTDGGNGQQAATALLPDRFAGMKTGDPVHFL